MLLLSPLLPLFSPLCHCSLSMPLISLSPCLSPFYHHFFPFAITPSPWAISLPCAIAPFLWIFSFSCAITFSPLPLFYFFFYGSFPFAIMHSPLPSLFPLYNHSFPLGSFFLLCRHTLPFTIVISLPLFFISPLLFPFCHCACTSTIVIFPLSSFFPLCHRNL